MNDVKSAPKPKKASARAKPAHQEAPRAAPETAPSDIGVETLENEQLASMQELSANLARAAMIAQGAIAEAALRRAEQPMSGMPSDPFRMGSAITGMMGRMASQPEKVLKAQADLFSGYMSLWQSTARRMGGEAAEPVVIPEKGDRVGHQEIGR